MLESVPGSATQQCWGQTFRVRFVIVEMRLLSSVWLNCSLKIECFTNTF